MELRLWNVFKDLTFPPLAVLSLYSYLLLMGCTLLQVQPAEELSLQQARRQGWETHSQVGGVQRPTSEEVNNSHHSSTSSHGVVTGSSLTREHSYIALNSCIIGIYTTLWGPLGFITPNIGTHETHIHPFGVDQVKSPCGFAIPWVSRLVYHYYLAVLDRFCILMLNL